MGRAAVEAEFLSEAGRIDLNAAPKETLAGLFAAVGVRKTDADYQVDRILGWRTRNQEADREEEASAYRVAGSPISRAAPRSRASRSSGSSWACPSSSSTVSCPSSRCSAAPRYRCGERGPDRDRGPARHDTGPSFRGARCAPRAGSGIGTKPAAAAAPPVQSDVGRTTRINLRIRFDNGRQIRAEAVIFIIEGDEEPYRILSWHDDFDGPG